VEEHEVNKIVLAPTSLPNSPPLEYVDAAAKAGYEAIGLRVFRSPGITYAFHPIAGDAALAGEVKKAIAGSGMEVVDALSFYMQPEMDFDAMQAPLDFAREVGATYALVIGDDPEWERMVQSFGHFCEMCSERGLIAAIEAPVVRRVIDKTEKAVRLIEDAGQSNAVIALDPLHFYRLGETPDVLKSFDPELFPYTQITDGRLEGPRCALGEGGAPLYGILDNLKPGLPLSLEWQPPRDPAPTAHEWAKHILTECKAFMEKYAAARARAG
jgi:sugar phosphate isomerase/epimerase